MAIPNQSLQWTIKMCSNKYNFICAYKHNNVDTINDIVFLQRQHHLQNTSSPTNKPMKETKTKHMIKSFKSKHLFQQTRGRLGARITIYAGSLFNVQEVSGVSYFIVSFTTTKKISSERNKNQVPKQNKTLGENYRETDFGIVHWTTYWKLQLSKTEKGQERQLRG